MSETLVSDRASHVLPLGNSGPDRQVSGGGGPGDPAAPGRRSVPGASRGVGPRRRVARTHSRVRALDQVLPDSPGLRQRVVRAVLGDRRSGPRPAVRRRELSREDVGSLVAKWLTWRPGIIRFDEDEYGTRVVADFRRAGCTTAPFAQFSKERVVRSAGADPWWASFERHDHSPHELVWEMRRLLEGVSLPDGVPFGTPPAWVSFDAHMRAYGVPQVPANWGPKAERWFGSRGVSQEMARHVSVCVHSRCRNCVDCRRQMSRRRERILFEKAMDEVRWCEARGGRTWWLTETIEPALALRALSIARASLAVMGLDFDALPEIIRQKGLAAAVHPVFQNHIKRLREKLERKARSPQFAGLADLPPLVAAGGDPGPRGNLRYLVKCEFQKNGNAHYHILLHEQHPHLRLTAAEIEEDWGGRQIGSRISRYGKVEPIYERQSHCRLLCYADASERVRYAVRYCARGGRVVASTFYGRSSAVSQALAGSVSGDGTRIVGVAEQADERVRSVTHSEAWPLDPPPGLPPDSLEEEIAGEKRDLAAGPRDPPEEVAGCASALCGGSDAQLDLNGEPSDGSVCAGETAQGGSQDCGEPVGVSNAVDVAAKGVQAFRAAPAEGTRPVACRDWLRRAQRGDFDTYEARRLLPSASDPRTHRRPVGSVLRDDTLASPDGVSEDERALE